MNWQDNQWERRAVLAFFSMPDCAAKRELAHLLLRAADQLTRPRCGSFQADGAPCEDVEPDCLACEYAPPFVPERGVS